MIRFGLKLILFLLIVLLPYLLVQYTLMKQNDVYYWKATAKAEHLVLGGSRALKGIFPSIVQPGLNLEGEMLNFAFTGVLSPYGQPYLRAIKRKLRASAKRSVFILSVCPGNLMDFTEATEDREQGFRFYRLWNMNAHPNWEYVLRHPRKGQALLAEWQTNGMAGPKAGQQIFQDGSQGTYLPAGFEPKMRERVIRYALERSPEREAALQELVGYLHEHGEVFLVRVPVSQKTLQEEEAIYPDFNGMIEGIVESFEAVYYLNYTEEGRSEPFRYSDGNHHLEGSSAEQFSALLAKDIQALRQ